MSLAGLERDWPLYAVPDAGSREASRERVSDAWPDFSSELSEAEIRAMAQNNRPAAVLWEAVRAVAMSVGLVIGLIALLAALGVR